MSPPDDPGCIAYLDFCDNPGNDQLPDCTAPCDLPENGDDPRCVAPDAAPDASPAP